MVLSFCCFENIIVTLILIMIMIMILLNTARKKPYMESLLGRRQMQLERCPGDGSRMFLLLSLFALFFKKGT